MDTLIAKPAPRRTRRKYDAEFRAQVIEASLHPGVSVAAVALANGLNANMLRKWVREHRQAGGSDKSGTELPVGLPSTMVPVKGAPNAPVAEIRIDVRRGGSTVQMAWPVELVASLGQCLRELLQ